VKNYITGPLFDHLGYKLNKNQEFLNYLKDHVNTSVIQNLKLANVIRKRANKVIHFKTETGIIPFNTDKLSTFFDLTHSYLKPKEKEFENFKKLVNMLNDDSERINMDERAPMIKTNSWYKKFIELKSKSSLNETTKD
jgi:hypothetical protein